MKKNIFYLFIIVLLMQMTLPFMNVASAEEKSPAVETTEEDLGANNGKQFKDHKSSFTYSEAVHLEITKSILKSKLFKSEKYAGLYNGSSGSSIVNNTLLLPDSASTESKDTVGNYKGIFRAPLFGKSGILGFRKDSYMKLSYLYSSSYFSVGGTEDIFTKDFSNLTVGADGSIKLKGFSNYDQYNDVIGMKTTLYSDSNPFRHKFVRLTLDVYGSTFSNENSAANSNISVDSYGNIITNNLEVVIPYWMNDTIDEFTKGDMFTHNYNFISSNALADSKIYENGFLKEFLSSKSSHIREYAAANSTSKNMPENIKPQFLNLYSSYAEKKKKTLDANYAKSLQAMYSDEAFLDTMAQYIVNITKDEVKKFNSNMIETISKDIKDGKKVEIYVNDSVGDDPSANLTGDLDSAKDYIYSAKNVLEMIGRIFEVGLFELIRLTVAGFVSDFYNSTLINFSVGEVFNTTLLSDSSLWKSIVNSILLLVVSFMTIYLILLLVRMFMGYITIKGIILRFVILALASISPMLVYSPLVDLAFNKPSEAVLSTEMDRMLVLDTWLEATKQDLEQIKAQKLAFVPNFNIRERGEEYTIPFYTSTSISTTYDLNTIEGLKEVNNKPNEKDVVVVNISAFHLFEWLEKGADTPLFEYLLVNYAENYEGIDKYEEYAYKPIFDINDGSNYKIPDDMTASKLMKSIYNNVENNFNVSFFNDSLYDLTNHIVLEGEYSKDAVNQVFFDVASTSFAREQTYGSGTAYSPTTEQLNNELTDFILPSSDLLGLEPIVKDLKPFRLDAKSEISEEVYKINKQVIDDYIENYLILRNSLNDSEGYSEAEKKVLMLNIFFAVNKTYDIGLFPTDIDTGSITLDTYVRALMVPMNKFIPSEHSLNNLANYISLNTDLLGSLLFVGAILAIFSYGVIKFIVLFALLMPAILASFFYNYVWLENKNSKAWAGALGILGAFALVNLGLLFLWKGSIYMMNNSVIESASVGVDRYPIVYVHSFLVILYVILAFKFVLKPLFNTVKGDLKNLGGTQMADGAMNLAGNIKGNMKTFWNNLSDSSSTKGKAVSDALGNTKLGNAMKSMGSALKTPTSKDKGMAGKLDANQIKSSKTESENEKDKEEIEKVTKKLEGNSNQSVSQGASNKVRGASGVIGAGVAGAVGGAVGAGAVTVGTNALSRMLGVNALKENLNNPNRRSVKETLTDVKNAAVTGWNNPTNLKEARELSEKLDSIEEIPLSNNNKTYTSEEMEVLESMGIDLDVAETHSNLDTNPVSLDTGSELNGRILSNTLNELGVESLASNGQVLLDGNNELMKTAEGRKALLNPVLDGIEKAIVELETNTPTVVENENLGHRVIAEKVSDKVFRIEGNELTGDIENYVNKLKSEGLGVETTREEDGSLVMTFQNKDKAIGAIQDIEDKSAVLAKYKGMQLGESNFDISNNELANFTGKLDEKGISYNQVDLGNGTSSLSILGGSESNLQVKELIKSDDNLSNSVREISDGIELVGENGLVALMFKEKIDNGELVEGVDVIVRDNNVYAKTDVAKRALYDVKDNYADKNQEVVDDLRDFAMTVTRTIVGEGKGGIEISDYESGTNEHLDSLVASSTLGKEKYIVNNRGLDLEELNRTVTAIGSKKHGMEVEKSNFEQKRASIEQEVNSLDNEYLTIKDGLMESRTLLGAAETNKKQLMREQELKLTDNSLSIGELESLNNHYESKIQEADAIISDNQKIINKIQETKQRRDSKKSELNSLEAPVLDVLSDKELSLYENINKANSLGVKWDRKDENKLEFVSEIRGQEDLVKGILTDFSEVSKLKGPKKVGNLNNDEKQGDSTSDIKSTVKNLDNRPRPNNRK